MKITIKGKTYEAERIPALMSRRAMELNIQALQAAADAETLKASPTAPGAAELLGLLLANLDVKANLICSLFGNQFAPEELLDELSVPEINALLNEITKGS